MDSLQTLAQRALMVLGGIALLILLILIYLVFAPREETWLGYVERAMEVE